MMIYLASRSKARKELLKSLGLKLKALPSNIKERRMPGVLSYARLVELNAENKAREVARKVKSGIIIAADTIVVCGGRIFGKPRDLKHAKRMLKILSQKPQWLYSGIAVAKKENGKVKILSGCEKTKIFMDKLTDKEIDDYFSKVSPLGMAGSFDIQGRGALFIRRIEGCFYNVVGLPVRKLYRMLKKLKANILVLLCLQISAVSFLLSGCSTEYNLVTKEEESYYYSTEKEEQMGQSIAQAIEKQLKLGQDPLMQKRVEDIGKKIAAVCDRKDIQYHFYVLDDEEINAVSLPGGYVYVNSGLIDKVGSDDELAGVLAHEVGHIVARHSIKKLQAAQAYTILRVLVAAAPQSGDVGGAADAAFTELLLGYGREDELLADQLGARYARLAGYDPRAMITFLQKLDKLNKRKPLQPRSYYKTHPYSPDRIRAVKHELGQKINFQDYINVEQKTHEASSPDD